MVSKILFKMTNYFFEDCKQLILLSSILRQQDFRPCFLNHFGAKIKSLNRSDFSSEEVKVLQSLQSKLTEPLIYHLKNSVKLTDKCLIIECLSDIVKLTPISSMNLFFDLYTVVFFQIFQDSKSKFISGEELKLSVLEFSSLLLKHSTSSLKEAIYAEKNGAKFSLGVSISVNLIKEDKSVKIRMASLEFLLAASQYNDEAKYNAEIDKKVGDLFALYLPGTITPLLEVILRDETQHHLITTKALSCWGHILCVVMMDFSTEFKKSEAEIIKEWQNHSKQSNENLLDLKDILKDRKRTEKWIEAAAIAVNPLITKIADVRRHSHFLCRLELTKVMIKLVKYCKKNLKDSLNSVVEVLVSSTYDENEKVKAIAEDALVTIQADCGQNDTNIFVSIIEENLYCLINKLPRIIRSGKEKLILSLLKSLLGHLKLLGRFGKLDLLINLSSTLNKLVNVLQVGFQLEIYPEISNREYSICGNEKNSQICMKSWKKFKYFVDESIKIQLEEICHTLSKVGQNELLFDFFLDSFNKENRNELLLILNEVVSSSETISNHVIRQLLEFYLEKDNLYPNLKLNHQNCTSIKEAQINITKVALIMEGLGKLANALGNQFEYYLLQTLYYVLERMGSPFAIIREAAFVSGTEIANACGLNGNIDLLITRNMDYLTYQLTIKLKRKDPGVFDVATVLLKNNVVGAMPHIEEIVNIVLESSSRDSNIPHVMSYLRVLQTFVNSVYKWSTIHEKKSAAGNIKSWIDMEMERLLPYLKSTLHESEESEESKEVEQEENDLIEEAWDSEKKKSLPKHIKMTLKVAEHCLHYLPSKDKDKSLIVLEILKECILVLADQEELLLPLVHKIWSPLVTKFGGIADPLLINKSFSLLCTLSRTSKDFIRSRTLKEVLPTLQHFLLKESLKSKSKDSFSSYSFTQNFKLQRELLENLGHLTSDLKLFEKQIDLVAESAVPYMSSFQPQELQDKSKKLFKHLHMYDSCLVWHKLHALKGNLEFSSNINEVLD